MSHSTKRVDRAHPRVGGENMRVIEDVPVVTGSSPRRRGKLGEGGRGPAGQGLIPA